MQKYSDIIFDASRTILTGVAVTVKIAGTGTLATLYSDNGVTPLANPFLNEADGSFEFYAANGRYDITFDKQNYTFDPTDTSDRLIFDFNDLFTGKGVFPVGTGNKLYAMQAPGSDRYVLIFDAAQSTGLRARNPWANSFLNM